MILSSYRMPYLDELDDGASLLPHFVVLFLAHLYGGLVIALISHDEMWWPSTWHVYYVTTMMRNEIDNGFHGAPTFLPHRYACKLLDACNRAHMVIFDVIDIHFPKALTFLYNWTSWWSDLGFGANIGMVDGIILLSEGVLAFDVSIITLWWCVIR
jgi:hypothetical protein